MTLSDTRTFYFGFAVLWIVASAFQYGYHISALNSAQDAISCSSDPTAASYTFPSCIPMTDALFGLVTSSYTIGGFFGSIFASNLADSQGRRKAVVIASGLIGGGSGLMAIAPFFALLLLGRTVLGIGCGLATVLVPMYLHEIAPPPIRGSIGVLNQLGIVFGILAGQALSLPFARPQLWRAIFVVSLGLSALQILSAPVMVESPIWAKDRAERNKPSDRGEGSSSEPVIEGHDGVLDAERQELLGQELGQEMEEEPMAGNQGRGKSYLSIFELLKEWRKDPVLAKGMRILVITQMGQQLSGINAVLYYSTGILKNVLPTNAAYISLTITFINVLMTFPPIFLIERMGRRSLILLSSTFMGISSLILALSINAHSPIISSIAIVAFVASFSVGLGPIPFVILSEVVPPHAASAASSVALGLNWFANFVVGLTFLPVRNALSDGKGEGQGNVFFIFAIVGATTTMLVASQYRN